MLCAVKHTVQAAESQALEAKREGANCHQYKDEMGAIQNGVGRHGTPHGQSATSLAEAASVTGNTSVLCGGTRSISLVSFDFDHLATLFGKNTGLDAFTKMFLNIRTLKMENKPCHIHRDHD